jgi:transcription initiation factor IIE alpha subunit
MSASPTVVKVVDELVQQGLPWDQTAVGKTVNEALEQLKAQMQQDLAAVTTQLQRLETQRLAEAEQARQEKAALKERYRAATQESNRHAMDAVAQLSRDLRAEQETRNAALLEKEALAASERDEYKTLLREAIERQERGKEVLVKPGVPAIAQPPKQTSLYFRYPGYLLLDWLAWLAWAFLILTDIAIWVFMSVLAADSGEGIAWLTMTFIWTAHVVLFSSVFFNSRGAGGFGLFLLCTNFAFRVYLVSQLDEDSAVGLLVLQFVCIGVVGLRYAVGS